MSVNKKAIFDKYSSALLTIFVSAVYVITLAPSVIQIDSGELAAVQTTLGIAHPTGYPLFTLVGYLFLKIPLPFTKIFQANLLAAFWCALGIYFFIKSSQLILTNCRFTSELPRKRNLQKDKPVISSEKLPSLIKLASLYSAFILAFIKTYWFQSTSVEVYSLQIFLFMLIIYFSLKAYYSTNNKIINWLYVAISLALGFSNHMTTLLLLPFIAILFFEKEKIRLKSIKKILLMLAVFIPLLVLFYLYLPLRASANPQINWGNPIYLENFLRHVSGKQYQVWLFASTEAAKKQLGYFLQNFPFEFVYIGTLLGLIGILHSYKISKKMFYTLLVTFLFALLYSINYDIVDIDSYFLLPYIIFSFFISFGILKILSYLQKKFEQKNYVLKVFGLVVLIPLFANFSGVNQSGVYTFEDYTRSILNTVEKNSIIFSYQWDYLVSPSYYYQTVENLRPDVAIVDKELLRRSWYYNQLKRNHPDIMKKITDETKNFLEAVRPFERDEQYDPNVIESSYRSVMTNLVAKNINERNFYIGMELFQSEMQRGEFSLPAGYQIVPHILIFKVVRGNDYVPAPDPNFTIRFPGNRNNYIDFIETTVGTMLTYRAAYELQFNKPERAKVYIEKVRKDFPNYQIPYEILSRVN